MVDGGQNVRLSRYTGLGTTEEEVEKNYDILEEVGRGKFAVVRRCHRKKDGHDFAGKFIRKKRNGKFGGCCEIQREMRILHLLQHENIVKFFEFYESSMEIILILELVTGGELFQYLVERGGVTEEESTCFIEQILEALKYMHQSRVVHLDLKPENVILSCRNSRKVKLIDFGLSVFLENDSSTRSITGTPEFVAPEVINYDPITSSADMWSIGVMTYIMLSGCSPFLGDDDQETLANVSRGEYNFEEQDFHNSSSLSKDFINGLLIKNPKYRATATECLEHSWIKPKIKEDVECKRRSTINVSSLKSFIARRRWRQSFHIVSLYNHLHKMAFKKQQNAIRNEDSKKFNNSKKQRMSLIQDYDSE